MWFVELHTHTTHHTHTHVSYICRVWYCHAAPLYPLYEFIRKLILKKYKTWSYIKPLRMVQVFRCKAISADSTGNMQLSAISLSIYGNCTTTTRCDWILYYWILESENYSQCFKANLLHGWVIHQTTRYSDRCVRSYRFLLISIEFCETSRRRDLPVEIFVRLARIFCVRCAYWKNKTKME